MIKQATDAIKNIAYTKGSQALFYAADFAFHDGSHGDWMDLVEKAIAVAQAKPKAEVWLLWDRPRGDCAATWWFGSEADIINRIQAL